MTTLESINTGSGLNAGDGDTIRDAFTKTNLAIDEVNNLIKENRRLAKVVAIMAETFLENGIKSSDDDHLLELIEQHKNKG